jgi:hypothetical protein
MRRAGCQRRASVRAVLGLAVPLGCGACSTGVGIDGSPFDDTFGGTEGADDGSMSDGSIPSGDTDAGDPGSGSDGSGDETSDPKDPACGDGVLDEGEACDGSAFPEGVSCEDLGYEAGTLDCSPNCVGYTTAGCFTCGNGSLEGPEDCEGTVSVDCEDLGFDGGTVTCGDDCMYDTSDCSTCGDGIVQGEEACDGDDLAAGSCEGLGYSGGSLSCTASCSFEVSDCTLDGTLFGSDSHYTGYHLVPAMLPCDEISGSGTRTFLTDDANVTVEVGFSFSMYGSSHDQANIQSNGALGLGNAGYMSFSNSCLPTETSPNTNNVYVYWDDLNPAAGAGEVYYQTLGDPGQRRFVVQWDTAHFGGDTADLMRIQAVLHEATGRIDVCYPDTVNGSNAANAGASATTGIQRDAQSALQYGCNAATVPSGTMLVYLPN